MAVYNTIFLDVSLYVSSGEGGIRTLGTVARTPVFETHPQITEATSSASTSDDAQSRFARRFAQSGHGQSLDAPAIGPVADPDLARVLDAWPMLTAPIRSAILALVESATRGG